MFMFSCQFSNNLYSQFNLDEKDVIILAAEEPTALPTPKWWIVLWNEQMNCFNLSTVLSNRWTILSVVGSGMSKSR